jgi:hypothetical protein
MGGARLTRLGYDAISMHVRVCPECHEEYRPEIVSCADCGVVLVDADDEAPRPRLSPAPAAPDGDAGEEEEEPARVLYFSNASARDLTPLADALVGAGMRFRIVAEGSRYTQYQLAGPEAEAEAARRLLAPVAASHPELGLRMPAPPLSEAEAEAERARATCPACEAHLPPDSRECPECGLSLYAESDEGED